jgi:undecaprenyl-diphosphatase
MNLWQALLLGIIQGLTEFIPISSSGHLILAEKLMGLEQVLTPAQVTAFIAVIQLGTLLAVIVYFARDIIEITIGFVEGTLHYFQGRRDAEAISRAKLGWLIIIGTIPIATIGLAARKLIEGSATKNLYLISASMIIWAILLWLAERVGTGRKEMKDIGVGEALVVGFAQVFALIPGSSRSGTTIAGALTVGISRATAARFSFLLSIPAIAASGLLELKKALDDVHGIGGLNLVIATIASAVVGYASIAFLLSYLRKHNTNLFVGYRLVAGAVLLALVLFGVVPAF